jgi:hypothetical protein
METNGSRLRLKERIHGPPDSTNILWFGILSAAVYPVTAQQERIVRVGLAYHAPGNGPTPDFSPYGTQVGLFDLPSDAQLPEGAARPAKTGTLQVGPTQRSWVTILLTADSAHPLDLCRLYIDANRNGLFGDDGLR